MDKDVVAVLENLKIGEYSQPIAYTDERGRKGVRVLYLKSRTEPHRMNIRDDYNRISAAALEEKKMITLDKWFGRNLSAYYIMLDPSVSHCTQLEKWANAAKVAGTQ